MKRYVKEFAADILRTVANITNEQYRKNVESKVDQVITKYEGNYITSFEAVEQLVKVVSLTATRNTKDKNSIEDTHSALKIPLDIDEIKKLVKGTSYKFDNETYVKDKTIRIIKYITLKTNTYCLENVYITVTPMNTTNADIEIGYEKITSQPISGVPWKEGRVLYKSVFRNEQCETVYELLSYCTTRLDTHYVRETLYANGKADVAVRIKTKGN